MKKSLYPYVLVTYVLLLVSAIGGLWWTAPDEAGVAASLIMTAVFYSPLLLLSIGLLLRDIRVMTWFCFLLLFYFCGYVTQVMDPSIRWLAVARVILTSLLFTLCMLYIRQLNQSKNTEQE